MRLVHRIVQRILKMRKRGSASKEIETALAEKEKQLRQRRVIRSRTHPTCRPKRRRYSVEALLSTASQPNKLPGVLSKRLPKCGRARPQRSNKTSKTKARQQEVPLGFPNQMLQKMLLYIALYTDAKKATALSTRAYTGVLF